MLGNDRVQVLVQGITGREGSYWTERMTEYGTEVAAGVTPGKGGQFVHGVPVYDSVETACGRHVVDASVDRKSTRLNSSHIQKSRMPSSA